MPEEVARVKLVTVLAILSALLLAGFLLLRPSLGEIGRPTPPNTSGRARRRVPDGSITSASAEPTSRAPDSSAATTDAKTREGIKHLGEVERLILELVNENRR